MPADGSVDGTVGWTPDGAIDGADGEASCPACCRVAAALMRAVATVRLHGLPAGFKEADCLIEWFGHVGKADAERPIPAAQVRPGSVASSATRDVRATIEAAIGRHRNERLGPGGRLEPDRERPDAQTRRAMAPSLPDGNA